MIQIAVLGTENSHALHFAQLMNGGHPMRNGKPYPDLRVVGAYGEDAAANREIMEAGGVEMLADHYGDFVGRVDAVAVTARHGGSHYQYAKPYLEAGIPVFVDKPITIQEEEAVALVRLAKRKGVPLCGGSCCALVDDTLRMKRLAGDVREMGRLTGGAVHTPVNMENPYGGFYFYAQHLVQIMLEVFGTAIRSVTARGRQKEAAAICRYDSYDVHAAYGSADYGVLLIGEKKTVYQNIDVLTDGYAKEVEMFAHMLRTGRMSQTYEELIRPVFVLNAMARSMETETETAVKKVTL